MLYVSFCFDLLNFPLHRLCL